MCTKVSQTTFEYKSGYLSCHDWRPRELNKQADAVCNWVLDKRGDIGNLDVHAIVARLAAGEILQLLSDGCFDGSCGAASVVAVCYVFEDGGWHASECSYRGTFISEAVS